MIGLQDFEGRWRLDRRIENAQGADARFEGLATFVPVPGGLDLHEAGTMVLDGQGRFHAERRYLWRAAGTRIAVQFDDGRAFHQFDPGVTAPEAHHLCTPDDYRVAYDFADWPRWRAVWRVIGPRKDYVMRSLYFRDAA